MVASLASWVEPWRHAYNSSAVVSTGVLFAHVASLVCAGGFSLAADRSLLVARRAAADVGVKDRDADTAASHRRLAARALAVVLVSGLLLFLSDVDSLIHVPTFWVKMGLVALLLANALRARRRNDARHAVTSVALWFLTLLAGTALVAG